MDLRELLKRGHGVVLLAGREPAASRAVHWDGLSHAVDALYLVGPLADQPRLPGPAKV